MPNVTESTIQYRKKQLLQCERNNVVVSEEKAMHNEKETIIALMDG